MPVAHSRNSDLTEKRAKGGVSAYRLLHCLVNCVRKVFVCLFNTLRTNLAPGEMGA